MEPNITPVKANQEEEVSLKELILKIQEWIKYLFSKWLLILVLGILGAGLGLTYSYFKKPDYVANLSFVLEDNKSGGLGGYAGLASQFGIDLGSASGSGVFAGDNIIEFLRSRLMVERTLLSSFIVNNKPESLADLYIEVNELREKWAKRTDLKDLHFPVNADRKNFTIQQDSLLNEIYLSIIKSNLSVTKPDKKLSFINVRFISKDEKFAKYFTERLVKEATDFYVQTKTKRSKTNVDKLQEKADSIEQLLNRKTYSAAASQDLNLNPSRNMARVSTELVTRDKVVLQTMYAEVVKNLELSRMSMAQETPLIQIVDTPILPLKKERFGKLKGLILGGIIAGLITISCLFIYRFYKKVMA